MLKIDQRRCLSFCLCFSGCHSRRESASVVAVAVLVVIPSAASEPAVCLYHYRYV